MSALPTPEVLASAAAQAAFQESLRSVGVHDHLCLIYEGAEERRQALVPFLEVGLARGERCVYIADADTAEATERWLSEAGLDIGPARRRGAFQALTQRDSYLRDGDFDPGAMIAFLEQASRRAVAEGFTALRATGEMTWALGSTPGERLVEYEARLNRFFPAEPAVAICQYERSRFPPALLKGILQAHPIAIVGQEVCRNPHYLSPDELLGPSAAEAEVDRLLRSVVERERAERLRHAYARSEAERARYARDLERSNADLQEFATVASHDMQEPLRKICAFGGYLRDRSADSLDEQGRHYLSRMIAAAERMRSLIDSLLELSRVSTRGVPFEAVDLSAVVQVALEDLDVRVRDTGARVDVGPLPPIRADRAQIRQLMLNLLGNALKFRRHGEAPSLRVWAEHAGDGIEIRVQDNGIGFDEKHLDRIFKPFQRLVGRGEFEGNGIGLAICQKIAARHGGSITAESAPGAGSTFVVRLASAPGRH